MKPRRVFRPDLNACVLEDRLCPAIPNLGVIVLTTGGFVLLTPFPGAYVSPASPVSNFGSPTASGVSGTPINTQLFIMGSGGISSVQPGNITGVPSLGSAGPTGFSGSPTMTISVGSGPNDATALNIQPVTRNTIANDNLNPIPVIGGQRLGGNTPVLPPGQSYRGSTPTAAPTPTNAGQANVNPPSTGTLSAPPFRYPPSIVPLVFPFQPTAGGALNPQAGSARGAFPGGAPAVSPVPSLGNRQPVPGPSNQE